MLPNLSAKPNCSARNAQEGNVKEKVERSSFFEFDRVRNRSFNSSHARSEHSVKSSNNGQVAGSDRKFNNLKDASYLFKSVQSLILRQYQLARGEYSQTSSTFHCIATLWNASTSQEKTIGSKFVPIRHQ